MIILCENGIKYYMKYFFSHSEWIKIENHLIEWESKGCLSGETCPITLLSGEIIKPEEMICKN